MRAQGHRTWGIALLVVAVSTAFLLNVWQSYRYTQVEREIQRIQRRHHEILEENKRLIVGIAGLRSPRRVRAIAEEDLNLFPAPADAIQRVDFPGVHRGR